MNIRIENELLTGEALIASAVATIGVLLGFRFLGNSTSCTSMGQLVFMGVFLAIAVIMIGVGAYLIIPSLRASKKPKTKRKAKKRK